MIGVEPSSARGQCPEQLVGVLQQTQVGTLPEQLAVASWFCWAVPLLITEALLQGRKIAATDTQPGGVDVSPYVVQATPEC